MSTVIKKKKILDVESFREFIIISTKGIILYTVLSLVIIKVPELFILFFVEKQISLNILDISTIIYNELILKCEKISLPPQLYEAV